MINETGRMKNLSESDDVFELKEEDQLAVIAAEKNSSKLGFPHALHVSGIDIHAKETDAGSCVSADTAMIDYNHDASGSFAPVATEIFAEETLESSNVDDFKSHGRADEIRSNIIELEIPLPKVECCSSPCATVPLDNHSNCAFTESSCNDESVHLVLDVNENTSERFPSDIAKDNASSDGPSSDNCFGDGDLGDERTRIVFFPDYMDYRSMHYLDPVVSFSRSYVEARSKAIYGDEETFHIHLEIKDIVKIESQWSAKYEAGNMIIYFISTDVAKEDSYIVHNASALQELKFIVVDSYWYEKQEAIESLDVRYKALWSQLDTRTDKCSAFPEGGFRILRGSYFPNCDRPFDEVIYPKGDPDAVSISKSDMDLLLPDIYVNDTIIDFYIKYLRTRQNVDGRTTFHFFNSFFFRKLADMDKDPSSAFDGKAAFQRVRKWTRKVNLLEKDFIFIPVNYSSHWSVVVICYFGEVASYEDDGRSERVPCILHMDSLRGNHIGLKDLIQSYLWEEWRERQKGTFEDLYSKFRNLKFVPLELPQQQNAFDCGLFLLHYVERFLEEVPANFSIYKITSSSKFLQADWFPPGEASMKRAHIEKLVNGLLDAKSKDCHPSGGGDMLCSPEDLNTKHAYDGGVKFSVKSDPLSGSRENSLCQVRQGIEMTLLPSSSVRNAQCTTTSGFVLKELFKQGSVSESFTDGPWAAFECRASLNEFKILAPIIEEEVEASECFVTEMAGPFIQHPEGVNSEAPVFPYSEDFRLEPDHQPTADDVDSSPLKSGELLGAEESQRLVEVSDRNGNSIFLKDSLEFGLEANELQNQTPVFHAIASNDKMDVSKCKSPDQTGKSLQRG